MKTNGPTPKIPTGLTLHFGCLAILLVVVWAAWRYLGEPYRTAFWCAVAFPIMHQTYVWLTWRLELQNASISRFIGFKCYLLVFFLLFGGRFVSLLLLGWIDQGSLGLDTSMRVFATVFFAVPGLYAMYSVKRYFGMARAAGADHFEPRYREMPLVDQGIFRYTSNGMYVYAFLLFWAIAVGLNSAAALVVTAFSHIYIWVHFYATEKPDMEYIYGAD